MLNKKSKRTQIIPELYERAINGLMKESPLIYYAYADFEEQRRKYDSVKKIYDKLLEIESLDPTLVGILLIVLEKFLKKKRYNFADLHPVDEIC